MRPEETSILLSSTNLEAALKHVISFFLAHDPYAISIVAASIQWISITRTADVR
ncbi:hypothetical protein ACLOJK_019179 [Asimina triloba]